MSVLQNTLKSHILTGIKLSVLNCYVHLAQSSKCLSSILLMPLLVLLSSKSYFVHPNSKQMFLPFLITILSMFSHPCQPLFSGQVKDCLSFISFVIWNAFLKMQEKHLSILSFPATSGVLGTNYQQSMAWCAVHGTWCSWCGSSKLLCLCHWDIVKRHWRVLFGLPR